MSDRVLSLQRWLLGARLKTLPAAFVPVLVGSALAVAQDSFIWWRALLALLVAVSLQVATNYVNDYADGDRGSDIDRVGPQRLVASGLATSSEVKKAALGAFLLAGIGGLALAIVIGPEILVVGVISIAAGWGYTGGSNPYGYMGLGEVFVFVFFGLVATLGSFYVHVETLSWLSLAASIPVGCLAVALMVTNNLRDIPGDSASGKKTLAVRLGDRHTRYLYVGLLQCALLGVVLCGFFKGTALLALPFFLLFIQPIRSVLSGSEGRSLISVLEASAKGQLIVGVFLAVGLGV